MLDSDFGGRAMRVHMKCLVVALLVGSSAMGATVISVTWNNSGTSGGGTGIAAVSWTQTGSWSNVAIGANLTTSGFISVTGTAYLMNQVGGGTTAANEMTSPAPLSISGNPGLNSMTTIFSGLSLGPGTYFLVVVPDAGSGLAWGLTGSPLQVLGSGITQNSDQTAATPNPFPPASAFSNDSNSRIFSVTGTAGAAPGVPEPSTVVMLLAGLSGLAVKARSRSRVRRVR
jgi:hypothetical protein